MNYLRLAHEREAFQRVFYDGTEVYVNKLAIRNDLLLQKTERAFTDRRALQGFPAKAHHRSYAGFKAIHRHLFQDLYVWAGKERTYTTGRGPLPFAVPEHIAAWMERQFSELKRANYLANLAVNDFAEVAARLVNEINSMKSTRRIHSSTEMAVHSAFGSVCLQEMPATASQLPRLTDNSGTKHHVLALSIPITHRWQLLSRTESKRCNTPPHSAWFIPRTAFSLP
jgi:Fic/DOC family